MLKAVPHHSLASLVLIVFTVIDKMAPKIVNNKATAKQANPKPMPKPMTKPVAKPSQRPLLCWLSPLLQRHLQPLHHQMHRWHCPLHQSQAPVQLGPPHPPPLVLTDIPIKQELLDSTVAKVEFTNSEKVMFSRWLNKCPERKLQHINFNVAEKNQLKSNWSLDPEGSTSSIASQTKKVTCHGDDE